MENNASNSGTTSSKKDDFVENRKRSPKNRNSRQSHKWRRTYSKKSKSGDKRKAYSPQLDSNNFFKVEIITTSDNENDNACMDSNDNAKKSKKRICKDGDVSEQIKRSSCDDKKSTDSSQCTTPVLVKEENTSSNLDNENDNACMDSNNDAKKSKKRICRDKDVSEQIKLSSSDNKKFRDSSQCSAPVLVKEENNASNLDDENNEACIDSIDDDAKKSKKKMCKDKDVTEETEHSSDDDKKSTDLLQYSTPVLVKEENNASNLDDMNDKTCIDSNDDDAEKSKKKICVDKDVTEEMEWSSDDDETSTDSSQFDTSLVKEENNASNLDVDNIKKRARTDDEDDDDYSGHKQKYTMYRADKKNTRWDQSTSGERLNQSLPSNIAHSTPVREYRHSQNRSFNMLYTTPSPYRINEVAPIYNGFQLLGDSQLLRFSQQLLPGRKNIYTPGHKLGPRRWGYCVSGQRTSDLVERLMRDECPLSRKVIVLIGTNDFLRKTPLQIFCNNYLSLVTLLKQKTETIILLTVPPVPKITDRNHWRIVQKFNNFINQFVDIPKVYCLDVASIYISYNNSTSMDYYEKTFDNNNEKKDYVHLNRLGFEMIQTMINHLLKSNNFC